jgi:glutathione synthase/RimK-type ligase-like ATP-grasp enzyme
MVYSALSPSMQTIAVYFTAPGFESYPFDETGYREAYEHLARACTDAGRRFAIVRGESTYQGGNRFRGGWIHGETGFRRTEEEIAADVIFLKGKIRFTDDPTVINDPAFDALCTDKWKTYRMFPDLSPKTMRVERAEELEPAIAALGTELLVAKPLDGEGGDGVVVAPKSEMRARVPGYPYLLQEFLDTSGGIPGLAEGMHDFRILSVRGTPFSILLRMPRKGSYLANVSQGGQKKVLPPEDIPPEALALFREIDAQFTEYPNRIYSVDLGRDKNGEWKIIELNAQPGLSMDDYAEHESFRRFFAAVTDVLLSPR